MGASEYRCMRAHARTHAQDERVLGLDDVELLSGRIIDADPYLIVSFNTQQVHAHARARALACTRTRAHAHTGRHSVRGDDRQGD
jgi:hypothetical protein